jgi:hypothetical protein
MDYIDDKGRTTKYDVKTLVNEYAERFAVIISESKGSEAQISEKFIEKAASCIFQSEGNHTVFLEMENGNYKEFRVNVSLDEKDSTKFVAEMQTEPLECSPNLVKFFKEKATFIISSNPEERMQFQVANDDQVITRE